MKTVLMIIVNATVFCVSWITGMLISTSVLGVTPPDEGNPIVSLLIMWGVCLLETIALHFYLRHDNSPKFIRMLLVFTTLFMVQFVFSQMETIYYLDEQTIPDSMIMATVAGGFIASLFFSIFLTYRYPIRVVETTPGSANTKHLVIAIAILGILVYPIIYYTAGYFIAWQSEVLRIYYSGSNQISSFVETIQSNIASGNYIFQAIRGLAWTILGVIILRSLTMVNWKLKGLILGLLFALLMASQLFLPNPYMPENIRMVHFIETASSNFIWGIVVSFGFHLSLPASTDPHKIAETVNFIRS